jgi:hypothetical protein
MQERGPILRFVKAARFGSLSRVLGSGPRFGRLLAEPGALSRDADHAADERALRVNASLALRENGPSKRRETMNEIAINELDQVSGGKSTFDVEQTLNIGSQSSGAGAGKVTFNPFSITRKVDRASPVFFAMS